MPINFHSSKQRFALELISRICVISVAEIPKRLLWLCFVVKLTRRLSLQKVADSSCALHFLDTIKEVSEPEISESTYSHINESRQVQVDDIILASFPDSPETKVTNRIRNSNTSKQHP